MPSSPLQASFAVDSINSIAVLYLSAFSPFRSTLDAPEDVLTVPDAPDVGYR